MIIEVSDDIDINAKDVSRVHKEENGFLGGTYYPPSVFVQLNTGGHYTFTHEHRINFLKGWNKYKASLM